MGSPGSFQNEHIPGLAKVLFFSESESGFQVVSQKILMIEMVWELLVRGAFGSPIHSWDKNKNKRKEREGSDESSITFACSSSEDIGNIQQHDWQGLILCLAVTVLHTIYPLVLIVLEQMVVSPFYK